MEVCKLKFGGLKPVKVKLPSSKSLCNRALVVSALAGGGKVGNISDCDDTRAVINALKGGNVIDIGAAGTAMRFLTAYFAQCTDCNVRLTGSERMRKRPISVLVDALREIGADINYAGEYGFPPLDINGHVLRGGKISVDSTVSSQYISALLMVAPLCEQGLVIDLQGNTASMPYILMTLDVMRSFGVTGTINGNEVRVGRQNYKVVDFEVEGDWSAASYWYEIIALLPVGSTVFLRDLRKNSVQGDSCVSEIFERFGVRTEYFSDGIRIEKNGEAASSFRYDFSSCPDLAQTLVATCCLLHIPFEFSGLKSLRIKETDRIAALVNECVKIGCELQVYGDDKMSFEGSSSKIHANLSFDTYDDHRMAMAFAPAAVIYDNVEIKFPNVVSKSYPAFWGDLENAGFTINIEQK